MSQIDYQRINFEDAPSTATPLSAANLNRMDNAIGALCDYLSALETTVGDLQELVDTLNGRVTALEAGNQELLNLINALDARVTALEPEQEPDEENSEVEGE